MNQQLNLVEAFSLIQRWNLLIVKNSLWVSRGVGGSKFRFNDKLDIVKIIFKQL